ncbi:MAG: hypothetical protein E6I06_09280 [Chloroflexi bacterium]|nr:MAG: hypothetical protein E6I06_09280 [Chloroflexota bacterium]
MRFGTISLALFLVPYLAGAQQPGPQGYVPPHGFVPDSATAVRIAIAAWIPIYGENMITAEKPFAATLQDSVWTVRGSTPNCIVFTTPQPSPPNRLVIVRHSTGALGPCPIIVLDGAAFDLAARGVAVAKIAQRDARILFVTHDM